MAFKMSVQKYSGKISQVEIGSGESCIKIGGENILPFYGFDGECGSSQKIGVEILDTSSLATFAHSSGDLSNPFGSAPSNFRHIKSGFIFSSMYLAHFIQSLATSL